MPLYDAIFPHHRPKYLHFLSNLLDTLSQIGNFQAEDSVYKILNDNVAAVDLVAPSVRNELFFEGLYQSARKPSTDGNDEESNIERLKQISLSNPDFLNEPSNRIKFSYFALVAGDVELAEQVNYTTKNSKPSIYSLLPTNYC